MHCESDLLSLTMDLVQSWSVYTSFFRSGNINIAKKAKFEYFDIITLRLRGNYLFVVWLVMWRLTRDSLFVLLNKMWNWFRWYSMTNKIIKSISLLKWRTDKFKCKTGWNLCNVWIISIECLFLNESVWKNEFVIFRRIIRFEK